MPVVTIDMWAGRDKLQKKKIIEKVTEAVVESVGCPLEAVHVKINEVPKENWGIAGKPCD